MRPKTSSMIKFGYAMLVMNLLLAVGAYFLSHAHENDPAYADIALPSPAMFLGGCCLWIIMILVWYKAESDEKQS